MNLDPSMTQSRPESRFTNIAIRFGLAAMAIAGCSNDSNDHDGTAVLKISPESVLACDVQPFNPIEYKKAMGMGPYAENTEADALKLDSKKVIAEFVNEIPKNTMGTALFSEMLKQQNGQYEIPSIIKGATDSFIMSTLYPLCYYIKKISSVKTALFNYHKSAGATKARFI